MPQRSFSTNGKIVIDMLKLILVNLFVSLLIQEIAAQEFPQRHYYDSVFLLNALNTYHSRKITHINFGGINPSTNVTHKIKRKLLSLLRREWNDDKIKIIVDSFFRWKFELQNINQILNKTNKMLSLEGYVYDSVYKEVFTTQLKILKIDSAQKMIAGPIPYYKAFDKAQQEAKRVSLQYKYSYDSVYRHTYDSTAFAFRQEKEIELKETLVPDDIVIAVAEARIYEAIPILKNDLSSLSKHYFSKDAVITALAALGDTLYLKRVFERHYEYINHPIWTGNEMFNDNTALLLIKTQESYALVADWIDTSKTYLSYSELENDPNRKTMYFSSSIIPSILRCLKNADFFEGYKKHNPPNRDIDYSADYLVTKEHLVYVKNWLIDNKGRYEFW